jgi:hypothetical protein
MGERVSGGQPLVASRHSALTTVFKILKEEPLGIRRDVNHFNSINVFVGTFKGTGSIAYPDFAAYFSTDSVR